MGKVNKELTMLIIVMLSVTILTLAESANAQSIPKPSVPEYTLKYVEHPYDVPPTYRIDPYTGKSVLDQYGYHVENKSIEITIRNQPFSTIIIDQSHHANFYYNVSYKGHYGNDWHYFVPWDKSVDWFAKQSESEYTVISLTDIPSEGGEIDIRVEAKIGYYTEYRMPYVDYYFTGQTSGWSNLQTINISDGSITTPTTLPLNVFIAIITVLVVVIVAVLLLAFRRHRITANLNQ